MKRGDLKKFYATPWIPYSLDDDRRNVFASVYYRCIQGMAETQQLRIAAAERYYLDALQLAEQYVGPNSVAAALPASLIARIRYEQGRLDEAESMLIDRVSLINAGAMLDCVLSAYFVMARIAVHRMNLERAHTLLELAENQGKTRGWGASERRRGTGAGAAMPQRGPNRRSRRTCQSTGAPSGGTPGADQLRLVGYPSICSAGARLCCVGGTTL